jgi:tetratricopeptide (TPR) repeat protein
VAHRYYNLSVALLVAGEMTAAADAAEKSIKTYEAALGPGHPSVGKAHFQAAAAAIRRGKIDETITHAAESIAINERWFGTNDIRLVRPLGILSNAYLAQRKLDLAWSTSQRALAILRAHDPKSIQIAPTEQGLALIALQRGDFAEAGKLADSALASAEAQLGADHLELINFLAVVAAIAREGPKPDLVKSEQILRRAQTIAAKHLPDTDRRRINLIIELAYTQTMAGKAADAIAALEPELARIDKLDLGVQTPHELVFALAKAHHARGTKKRACELAARSVKGYTPVSPPMAKQVTAWVSANCSSRKQ